MAESAKTTTYGIVARDAPVAVILRRGPTRYTRMLRWDLRDNTIVPGQWLVGRVRPGPCGLSPDGELFVYEARRKSGKTFTAISRPPYFTALAYWEYSAPWTGGGFFSAKRAVVLGLNLGDPSEGSVPPDVTITDAWSYFSMSSLAPTHLSAAASVAPEANHGWIAKAAGLEFKSNPARPRVRLERIWTGRTEASFRVVEASKRYELGAVDWADWSHDGELLLGSAGCLHREALPRVLAPGPGDRRLIADLNGQSFESVLAPAEMHRWPGGKTRRRSRAL